MACYFVSRHEGAIAWVKRRMPDIEVIPHLDLAMIASGDHIYGTLPIQLAAAVAQHGAQYHHLILDIPQQLRGTELSSSDMEKLGARFETYHVQRLATPSVPRPFCQA